MAIIAWPPQHFSSSPPPPAAIHNFLKQSHSYCCSWCWMSWGRWWWWWWGGVGSKSLSLPLSPLCFFLPPLPSFVSLWLYLSLPLSGGCHHGDSAVPMLQYEDQEGCSLSPMATASIGCEHRVAHIKPPPPPLCLPHPTRSLMCPPPRLLVPIIPPHHTYLDVITTLQLIFLPYWYFFFLQFKAIIILNG